MPLRLAAEEAPRQIYVLDLTEYNGLLVYRLRIE